MKENRIIPVISPENTLGFNEFDRIETDPQGSYTGRPEDQKEVPVQDADDL